ncbi:MAG: hypoxanthine phosphoribosyltransferase [Actinomycetota bacterium]
MSDVASVLFREPEIQRRVRELGQHLTRDYAGRSPVFISVLKGGFVFLADLIRAVDIPLRVDFMSISRYGSPDRASASGVVRVLKDLDQDIGGEDVVVVEDIIDTGLTLSYLLTTLQAREPASVEVVTLLDKSVRRIAPLDIKYVGFDCPDRFVVGYGLDVGERYRNLPFIVEVANQSLLQDDPDALSSFLAGAAEGSG